MIDKKAAYFYLTITFFAWGSLYVVSKFVLGKVPAFTVSSLRFLIAGIILLIFLKKRNPKKIQAQDYKYIFVIGFAGYFLSSSLQLVGTKLSNASLSSLINSMNPITIMLFASFILKEKLTVKKVICVILAVIGVYIVIGGINGKGQVLGIMISVSAVFLWSFATVTVRRIAQKYDPFQITTYGIIVGFAFTFPVSAYELITTPNVQFDLKVILAIIYMGIVCTAFAHVLWNKSLSILEAGACSLFYPVQPMVAVLLGWMFLGEEININFIFGTVLIIGGVLISIPNKTKVS